MLTGGGWCDSPCGRSDTPEQYVLVLSGLLGARAAACFSAMWAASFSAMLPVHKVGMEILQAQVKKWCAWMSADP